MYLLTITRCYISHSAKNRTIADFDPQGAKTPEPILMKLGRNSEISHIVSQATHVALLH